MAKEKSGQLVWQRRERGTSVPLSVRRVKMPDGSMAIIHSIDLGEAEVPDKTYFAVGCGADYFDDSVRLMFCQPKLGGKVFRSMVLLVMTPSSLINFSKALSAMKDPSMEEIVVQVKVPAKKLLAIPDTEPDQTAELNTNMAAVAVNGHECCIDFYHANAFSHLMAQKTNSKHISLDPTVRVTMNTGFLVALKTRLGELADQLVASGVVPEGADDDA